MGNPDIIIEDKETPEPTPSEKQVQEHIDKHGLQQNGVIPVDNPSDVRPGMIKLPTDQPAPPPATGAGYDKPKHAGGRPTVMTPEILQKLKDGFLMGYSDAEACAYADIGTGTLYNYQNENPEFLENKEKWKENPILKAKSTIYGDLRDPKTAKWYLERIKKSEFSTRTEHTGKDGQPLMKGVTGDTIDAAIDRVLARKDK